MKKSIFWLTVFSFLIIMIVGCKEDDVLKNDNDESLKSASVVAEAKHVQNEMLIKFKEGVSETQKIAILAMLNGKMKEKILTKAMEKMGDKEGVSLISLPGAALEAIAKVKGLPELEYAEPNYIYEHCSTSNDTYYTIGSLWGMYGDATSPANPFGSQAGEAWAAGHTGSSKVYVGIIDEGYMYEHVDLAANTGVNPGEKDGNGVDDDGNGYVDDVYGWDFANDDKTIFDGTATNGVDYHGTHVAGTIGAVGGNGEGVAGVCWTVRFLSGKFLGPNGGTTANAIKAVDYFTNLKTKGLNIVATNNSWGGGGFSQGLQDAIERANAANILFIAAAGNEKRNIDRKASYPAAYPNANIISVASITSAGALSSFSNYGVTKVDLGAPGSSIMSTLPINSYGSYSGTSMATPHVTGAVALYASRHSENAAKIKAVILSNTVATTSLKGKCVTGGRLNVSGF